jgi:hypothetical protein
VVPNWNIEPILGFLILFRCSVGLLWTSDQPIAKASAYTNTERRGQTHALSGIRTHNHSDQAIKTYVSDCVVTGTGVLINSCVIIIESNNFIWTSDRNGNLELPVYFLKAKQGLDLYLKKVEKIHGYVLIMLVCNSGTEVPVWYTGIYRSI